MKNTNKPGFRVKEMYAWLVVDADDTEGVPAFTYGKTMMPLMGADIERAKSMKLVATQIAEAHNKKVVLAKFSQREDIEIIEP